jgi:hypothetical protein
MSWRWTTRSTRTFTGRRPRGHRPARDAGPIRGHEVGHRDRSATDRILVDVPVQAEAGTDQAPKPTHSGETLRQDQVGDDITDPPALAQTRRVPIDRGQRLGLGGELAPIASAGTTALRTPCDATERSRSGADGLRGSVGLWRSSAVRGANCSAPTPGSPSADLLPGPHHRPGTGGYRRTTHGCMT